MVEKKSIKVLAPAKINLHLAIGEKRDDNYHNLQSIFARIALFDEIEIKIYEASELQVSIMGLENMNLKGDDTLTKAAYLWAKSTKVNDRIVISIKKNIPSEAGLGGGSSDGASVLLALQKIYPNKALSFEHLIEIAGKIGSDVPFFMYETTFAYVCGRGEFVYPIESKFNYQIHLVKPKIGIKTKNAFSQLDKIKRLPFYTQKELTEIFKGGISFWERYFFNDFERVIKSNILEQTNKILNFTKLSGSGSTCFEIVENSKKFSLKAEKDEFDFITSFY